MHSDDARGSLDNIRRLQERGIDAYVRHMYARPYVFASALMVFIVFASFDLPRPWDTTAVAAGLGIGLLPTLLMRRRAPVLRRLSGPELLLAVGLAAALLVAYVLLQIVAVVATLTLGMPAPHTVAAAAVALLVLAAAGPARRVTAVVVRRATTARNGRRT